MKKIHTLTGIAALATLSLTTVTQGAAIYSQDFSGAVTSTAAAGKQTYGAGNAVEDQEFGFGSHSLGGQATVFTTGATGEMQISAFAPPTTGGRYYGSATTLYLDTVSWAAGDYTVTFDVANYAQGANDSHFGVYKGNVAAGSTLSLRVNDGNAASEVYPAEDGSSGTVSYAEIGLGEQITTGVTSISYNFTLTDAGNTGDYLVLGWGTRSGISGATGSNLVSDSFSVDNIVIVPEPGTYALLGGLLALGAVMVRRRR